MSMRVKIEIDACGRNGISQQTAVDKGAAGEVDSGGNASGSADDSHREGLEREAGQWSLRSSSWCHAKLAASLAHQSIKRGLISANCCTYQREET